MSKYIEVFTRRGKSGNIYLEKGKMRAEGINEEETTRLKEDIKQWRKNFADIFKNDTALFEKLPDIINRYSFISSSLIIDTGEGV
jgi:hypothetical protein